jgi:hypothetical protein
MAATSVWIKVPEGKTWGLYVPPGPRRWRWVRVECCSSYRKAYRECVKVYGRMRAHEYVLIPGRDDEEIAEIAEGAA